MILKQGQKLFKMVLIAKWKCEYESSKEFLLIYFVCKNCRLRFIHWFQRYDWILFNLKYVVSGP